jgi:hypothetical protein
VICFFIKRGGGLDVYPKYVLPRRFCLALLLAYYLPSQRSQIGKRNSNEKGEESSDDTSPRGDTGRLRSHTARLKIQSSQVSEREDKDSTTPIPKNGIRKSRQRHIIGHLV